MITCPPEISLVFNPVICHVLLKFLCRYRLGIEVALNEVTFCFSEEIHLFLLLDTFGDYRHIQRFGEIDDIHHHDVSAVGIGYVAEEFTVYLKRVKGKVFEGRTRLRFSDDLSLIFLYQYNHLFWKIRRERTRVMSSTLMSRRTLVGSLSSIAIIAWVS